MTDHFTEFPYEEIRRPDGDFFGSWAEAKAAGYADNQIWSVTECEGTWTYGPPHHYVNHIGHIATQETHDNETYYHEVLDTDYDEDLCDECGEHFDDGGDGFDGLCPSCADKAEAEGRWD